MAQGKRPQGKKAQNRPRPKAKARVAPRLAPRRRLALQPQQRMPRGLPVFSPFSAAPVPVALPEGSAFPVAAMNRLSITTSSTDFKLFLIGNHGDSSTAGVYVTNGAIPAFGFFNMTTLNASASAGGPTSGRAMKSGLTLVNTTQSQSQSGTIYALCVRQRLALPATPAAMTQAEWNTVADTIRTHTKTRVYSGSDFRSPKHWYNHVVDDSAYTSYSRWEGSESVTEWFEHFAEWSGSSDDKRPMSCMAILIEANSVAQAYQMGVYASYYTRWPLGTVMSDSQVPVPVAPHSTVVVQRTIADELGSVARDISEVAIGGGIAAVASRLQGLSLGGAVRGAAAALMDAAPLALAL